MKTLTQSTSPAHLVIVGDRGGNLTGRFLQGPRTPSEVRRRGYGFTSDPAAAWPFPSAAAAAAKAAIVDRHIGWGSKVSETTTAPQP
jgi:hypothetical protein